VTSVAGGPAAGGGRWVEVDPARLARWLAGFAQRHGRYEAGGMAGGIRLRAADGSVAECLTPPGAPKPEDLDGPGDLDAPVDLDGFVAAATEPRRLGLLLARRGGVAVGIANGDELEVSKVDSRYVQGRTAAGGWSQQRFARRRENQARAAATGAADIAARLLLPAAGRLAAVVTGGDRQTVDAILADVRLGPVAALRAERFLAVGEPKLATLAAAVRQARAVRIRLVESEPAADSAVM
jgi:Actinobacteria/chloroflexi VLRF1 release factor